MKTAEAARVSYGTLFILFVNAKRHILAIVLLNCPVFGLSPKVKCSFDLNSRLVCGNVDKLYNSLVSILKVVTQDASPVVIIRFVAFCELLSKIVLS